MVRETLSCTVLIFFFFETSCERRYTSFMPHHQSSAMMEKSPQDCLFEVGNGVVRAEILVEQLIKHQPIALISFLIPV